MSLEQIIVLIFVVAAAAGVLYLSWSSREEPVDDRPNPQSGKRE